MTSPASYQTNPHVGWRGKSPDFDPFASKWAISYEKGVSFQYLDIYVFCHVASRIEKPLIPFESSIKIMDMLDLRDLDYGLPFPDGLSGDDRPELLGSLPEQVLLNNSTSADGDVESVMSMLIQTFLRKGLKQISLTLAYRIFLELLFLSERGSNSSSYNPFMLPVTYNPFIFGVAIPNFKERFIASLEADMLAEGSSLNKGFSKVRRKI